MSEPGEPTAVKLTHRDYLLFPEDGKRHELLDGEHFVTPSPRVRHERVSQNLNRILDRFVHERRLGEVFTAPLDVILSEHDVVQPDLLFVSAARAAIVDDWVRGAPDLVVEIASETTRRRDETLKAAVYERFGVREYWIVDPEAETVAVRHFGKPGGESPAILRGEEELTTPLLPGLTISLPVLFK